VGQNSAMRSSFVENFQLLARYNAWFNLRVLDACEKLGDAQRKLDRGAFFGSIHGTLNHLLWADTLWLARFPVQEAPLGNCPLPAPLLALPAGPAYTLQVQADWPALRAHRLQLDIAIEQWAAALTPECLEQTMVYANSKGVQRRHPAWQALTHFFNHQTHHRGQMTTLLMQDGVDVGVTDLVALL